jgi:hypothetical protein
LGNYKFAEEFRKNGAVCRALRSSPLYHSRPQTALPDLFVFFRRFVRQPKEIPPFSGQHRNDSKFFQKILNTCRRKSNGTHAASGVLSMLYGVRFFAP